MTISLVIPMPITENQIGLICIILMIFVTAVLAFYLGATMWGIIYSITFILLFVTCVIVPWIAGSIPSLSLAWQVAEYSMIHPETWFNITVV